MKCLKQTRHNREPHLSTIFDKTTGAGFKKAKESRSWQHAIRLQRLCQFHILKRGRREAGGDFQTFFFFSFQLHLKKNKKHVIPNDLPKIRDLTPAACSNNPTVAISLARSNVRRKNKKHGPPPPGPAAALPLHLTADGSEKQKNARETLAGHATEVKSVPRSGPHIVQWCASSAGWMALT